MGGANNPQGRVKLLDVFGQVISDTIGAALVITDIDHYLIHLGLTWVHSDSVTVNNGASLDFLIANGSTGDIHIKEFTFTSTQAEAEIILYGSPDASGGTPKTWINKCLACQGNTPQTTIKTAPTVVGPGTQLEHFLITGGKQNGGSVPGGGDEWVIPVNTSILLRYTNNAALPDLISYSIKCLDIGNLP